MAKKVLDKKQLYDLVKKYWWEVSAGVILAGVYFATRLINLDNLPVFADEAIYVRWAQIMRNEPTLRFLPLSDGKPPLFMWLVIPFLKFFSDPLIAGRFVSILAGAGSAVGIFVLSWLLFNRKVAWLATLFYVIVPYTLFFDRMALVDSMLNFWAVWSLFLVILLARTLRFDVAMLAGFAIVAGLLTKPPAQFFFLALPLSLLIFNFKKPFIFRLARLFGLWIVTVGIALGFYNFLLRLGPNFQLIAARNTDYVFTIGEVLSHPFDPFRAHLVEIWNWFGTLLTWPVFIGAIGGGILGIVKRQKAVILILLWVVIPLLVQSEFARVFAPRYLLFSATPVLILAGILAAFLFEAIRKRFTPLFWSLLIIIIFTAGIFDFMILTNPAVSPLPRKMRSGYLEEWTSGFGIKQVAEYLKQQAARNKVMVGTEGYFGTLPDGLVIYLEGVPNITVIGIGVPVTGPNQALLNSLADSQVFLVVNESRAYFSDLPNLELVAAYPKAVKPDGTVDHLLLFKVIQAPEESNES